MFLYLAISPVLRFGLNKEYTPLSSIGGDDYRNSMIYAAVNLIFIFFIAFLGYSMLRAKHHRTYHGMCGLPMRGDQLFSCFLLVRWQPDAL